MLLPDSLDKVARTLRGYFLPSRADVAALNRTHNLKYCEKSVIPNEPRKPQNLYSRIQNLSSPVAPTDNNVGAFMACSQ